MDGMLALRGAISEALRGRKKNKNQIRRGTVSGGLVYINGRGYVYSAAVDINIVDGMSVWCELSGTRAVIVGA